MSEDTGYVPRSPDLTSFYSADTTPHNHQSYQHQPPSSHLQGPAPGLHFQSTGSPDAAPDFYNQESAEKLAPAYSPPVQGGVKPSQPFIYPLATEASVAQGASHIKQVYDLQSPSTQTRQSHYHQQALGESIASPATQLTRSPFFATPVHPIATETLYHQAKPDPSPSSTTRSYFAASVPPVATETSSHYQPKTELSPPNTTTMPPRRSAAVKVEEEMEIEPSPVRTKFPTARIKRIMQADEEVGKVAQQTPIAVGKALEMFMISLVTKSAAVAQEKNSKRVSAQMLKQVVESDEQFDFLHDTVSKVENEEKASKGGRSSKNESSSDEEAVPEKKKGRPGRKKKAQ